MGKQSRRRYKADEEVVLGLIGSVYDASFDAAAWPGFLEKLSDLSGNAVTGIFSEDVADSSNRLAYSVHANPALEQRYEKDFSAKNVFAAALRTQKDGGIVTGRSIIADSALTMTEYYADWMAPQKMFHTLHSVVLRDDTHVVRLAAGRAKSAGQFDQTEINIWKLVIPHLRRAVQIRKLNSNLSMARNVMDEGLSRRSLGLLLVNADGAITDMNSFADRIMEKDDGLTIHARKIVTKNRNDQDRLDTLIRYVAKSSQVLVNPGSSFLNILRPSGQAPYKVLIAPARAAVPFLDKKPSVAAVYITDPGVEIRLETCEIKGLYGLTNAESGIAILIVKGRDVKEAASELGISTNTVRTHLKRIFEKTDTKRQSHLVLKLLSSPL